VNTLSILLTKSNENIIRLSYFRGFYIIISLTKRTWKDKIVYLFMLLTKYYNADTLYLKEYNVKQRIGQPEILKEINRTHVLDIIKRERVVSRAQLARITSLSRATISLLVDKLLTIGVVEEIGRGESSGGRPPVLLKFIPDSAFAMGAHMYDSDWSMVVTNLDAVVRRSITLHIEQNSPRGAIDTLKRGIEILTSEFSGKMLLPAIGLGTPGLVDIHTGTIKSAVDVGWAEVPVKKILEEETGLKTFVANRSKVGALAELWYGAREGIKDLIYISIGTGIAAGIIHQGKLYIGTNSSAGELGHVTIIPDGPLCPCGNRGCLQQLVSEQAIATRARQLLRENSRSRLHKLAGNHPEMITVYHVLKAADEGDELALSILDESAEYLGIAVANLVNLFNPELIVLGGPVGQSSRILTDKLAEKVRLRAMAYPLSAVQIVTSSLGSYSGAIGASVLVLQQANRLIFQ